MRKFIILAGFLLVGVILLVAYSSGPVHIGSVSLHVPSENRLSQPGISPKQEMLLRINPRDRIEQAMFATLVERGKACDGVRGDRDQLERACLYSTDKALAGNVQRGVAPDGSRYYYILNNGDRFVVLTCAYTDKDQSNFCLHIFRWRDLIVKVSMPENIALNVLDIESELTKNLDGWAGRSTRGEAAP